jgi:hypothetical protein
VIALAAGIAFAIAPGRLSVALHAWGRATGIELLFREGDLAAYGTLGFKCGSCSPYEALDGLIDGQPVHWSLLRNDTTGVVTIVLAPDDEKFQP